MSKVNSFFWDESGATAIEYALIAGSISIVIVAVALGIGTDLVSIFTKVANGFQ